MKTKHTKGKWSLDCDSITTDHNIKGNIICDAPRCFDNSMKNWEANAKLIAAAPELLEQLNKIVNATEDGSINSDHINYSKELIKKATK